MKTTIARAALFGALSLALVLTAIPAAYAGQSTADRSLKPFTTQGVADLGRQPTYAAEGVGLQGRQFTYVAEGVGLQGRQYQATTEGYGAIGRHASTEGIGSIGRASHAEGFGRQGTKSHVGFVPSISDFLLRLLYLH